MKKTSTLRKLLERRGVTPFPGTPDALTARLVQDLGFEGAYLGGYMSGASLCTTEPLTGLTEMTMLANYITNAIDIPLIIDGDAGFGDATYTTRMVKEFEKAGIAGVHIEDQVFPKRVSYHTGLKHIISVEEMLTKVEAALKSREDPDFIIIVRSDALSSVEGKAAKGGDEAEAIRRCQAYLKAGADAIMPSGWTLNDINQVKRIAEAIDAPLVLLSPDGFSHAGCATPKISLKEFENAGVRGIIIYPITPTLLSSHAIMQAYKKIKTEGWMGIDQNMLDETRKAVEKAIHIKEYSDMEKRTSELWEKERTK
jgi:methylisocitrate lyase